MQEPVIDVPRRARLFLQRGRLLRNAIFEFGVTSL
jgi:hypothetical protein